MLVVTGTYVDMPVLCTGSLDLKRATLVPPERSGEWVESLGHIANETPMRLARKPCCRLALGSACTWSMGT